MSDEKIMEAAVSAVMNYIKEEELEQQKNADEKELWGISGRQTQMETRERAEKVFLRLETALSFCSSF
jgi:hypothetical protein